MFGTKNVWGGNEGWKVEYPVNYLTAGKILLTHMWICKISCFRSIKKLIGQLFKIFETLTVSMNSLFFFISVICFYLLSAVLLWTGNVFSRGRESPKRQSGDWPHTCTHGCMWKVWPEGGARGHVMYVTKTLQWILWGLWSHFIITTHIYYINETITHMFSRSGLR